MRQTVARIMALIGVVSIGCGNEEETITVVTTPAGAVDVILTDTVGNAVLFAATDPFDAFAITPEGAATAAAAAAANYYRPSGCVNATASGANVTYNLNNCTGPLGIVGVSGTINVNYASQAPGIKVTVTSSNLRANGATINLNIQALYTQVGNTRQLAVTNNSSAKGSNGNNVTRATTGTLVWNKGDTCAMFNATGALQVNNNSMNQNFSNNQLCTARCPSGTLTLSNANNETLTLTLNATRTVAFADNRGHSGTIEITCGQ